MAKKEKDSPSKGKAKEASPRRIVKKSESVRTQREKAASTPAKKRPVRNVAKKARTPIRAFGRFIAKILRPFRFLLWPFKTRLGRFVGRILSKLLLLNYFKASWTEVKLVAWPNRKNTFKLTVAVFIFAISFATVIGILDYILDKIFKQLLT